MLHSGQVLRGSLPLLSPYIWEYLMLPCMKRLMLTELFAQRTEEGSVTAYVADDCMTALKGVLVTDEYSNLWFVNRTFA
jgi:hypothetical protein